MFRHENGTALIDVCRLAPEVRDLREHLVANREMLNALADPARQDLVQLLARDELNVGEIASRIALSRPNVSHHLGILRRAGLVQARKQGKEVYYRLDKDRIIHTLSGLCASLTCC
ncbi:MAG TPA: metalloregulator ArsR/SmtB family transcription factor [Chloroflexota bacterium]|jgi:DNA-binding transcriptional ArsR family regulator|nr:metalloregulator ArsR/SmtB family transcription factor [Chloroflexota bacterium]